MKKKKSENNRKEKEIQIRPGPGQNKMSARTSCGGNHEPRRRLNRRNVAALLQSRPSQRHNQARCRALQ